METMEANQRESLFFFPLRANVGYFDSPENYLSLIERIKQASLLYDRLVFEGGHLSAAITERGSFSFWTPPAQVDIEALRRAKETFRPVGGEAALIFQSEGGQPTAFISAPVIRRFHAEFHSTLDSLDAENCPWINLVTFELPGRVKQIANDIKQQLANHFDEALPGVDRRLKASILDGLSADLAVTQDVGAATSICGFYSPLISRASQFGPAPGFASLEIAVPDLGHLNWHDILELRDQECLVHFRRKLWSVEENVQVAIDAGELDEAAYQFALLHALHEEVVSELADSQPKLGEAIGDVLLDLTFGLFPGVSAIMTGLRGSTKLDRARRSWVAAFMRLRKKHDD